MKHQQPIRVLFVCTGNICRSPMAEAVFQDLVIQAGIANRFEIASAGTGTWHVGERPHHGTQDILRKRNVPLAPDKHANHLTQNDFTYYDYIIAMDKENVANMTRYGKVPRLLDFAEGDTPRDVPDPYYTSGFDYVYELVLNGCRGLLAHIREQEEV